MFSYDLYIMKNSFIQKHGEQFQNLFFAQYPQILNMLYCTANQEHTIERLPYLLGEETEAALRAHYTGVLPTYRQLSEMTDEALLHLQTSDQVKGRIKALRCLVQQLRPDASVVDRVRALCTCPLTLEVVRSPAVSPCCGAVFEGSALFTHIGSSMVKQCPLCRAPMSVGFLLNRPRQHVVSRIVDATECSGR